MITSAADNFNLFPEESGKKSFLDKAKELVSDISGSVKDKIFGVFGSWSLAANKVQGDLGVYTSGSFNRSSQLTPDPEKEPRKSTDIEKQIKGARRVLKKNETFIIDNLDMSNDEIVTLLKKRKLKIKSDEVYEVVNGYINELRSINTVVSSQVDTQVVPENSASDLLLDSVISESAHVIQTEEESRSSLKQSELFAVTESGAEYINSAIDENAHGEHLSLKDVSQRLNELNTSIDSDEVCLEGDEIEVLDPSLLEEVKTPIAGDEIEVLDPSLLEEVKTPIAGEEIEVLDPSLLEEVKTPIAEAELISSAKLPSNVEVPNFVTSLNFSHDLTGEFNVSQIQEVLSSEPAHSSEELVADPVEEVVEDQELIEINENSSGQSGELKESSRAAISDLMQHIESVESSDEVSGEAPVEVPEEDLEGFNFDFAIQGEDDMNFDQSDSDEKTQFEESDPVIDPEDSASDQALSVSSSQMETLASSVSVEGSSVSEQFPEVETRSRFGFLTSAWSGLKNKFKRKSVVTDESRVGQEVDDEKFINGVADDYVAQTPVENGGIDSNVSQSDQQERISGNTIIMSPGKALLAEDFSNMQLASDLEKKNRRVLNFYKSAWSSVFGKQETKKRKALKFVATAALMTGTSVFVPMAVAPALLSTAIGVTSFWSTAQARVLKNGDFAVSDLEKQIDTVLDLRYTGTQEELDESIVNLQNMVREMRTAETLDKDIHISVDYFKALKNRRNFSTLWRASLYSTVAQTVTAGFVQYSGVGEWATNQLAEWGWLSIDPNSPDGVVPSNAGTEAPVDGVIFPTGGEAITAGTEAPVDGVVPSNAGTEAPINTVDPSNDFDSSYIDPSDIEIEEVQDSNPSSDFQLRDETFIADFKNIEGNLTASDSIIENGVYEINTANGTSLYARDAAGEKIALFMEGAQLRATGVEQNLTDQSGKTMQFMEVMYKGKAYLVSKLHMMRV